MKEKIQKRITLMGEAELIFEIRKTEEELYLRQQQAINGITPEIEESSSQFTGYREDA